VTGFVCSW